MKKTMIAWAILISIAFSFLSCSLPAMATITTQEDMGWELTHMLYITTHGFSDTARYAQASDFIVSERENGDWRGLAVFTKHNDAWRVDFLNGHALKYKAYVSKLEACENPTRIRWQYDQDGVTERFVFEGIKNPLDEYSWHLKEYVWARGEDNQWKLESQDSTGMVWRTQRIMPGWQTPVVHTYEGALQDDLRTFKLASFPTNEELLALALVDIPQNQQIWDDAVNRDLTLSIDAQWMDCKRDRIYPVYSGPGPAYTRAASGQAQVSTNDSIFVFGEENGYLLIYYRTNNDRLRIGYIPVEALAYEEVLEKLNFVHIPAKVIQACEITDDPIDGQDTLAILPQDSAVRYLSLFRGVWAYVETETAEGTLIRGFVLKENLCWER
ncbi:MAG: hypothetical protein FWF69_07015 [Firmicutes bacterium]|nr:hypothetical protein [Bacillota bacterium]